MSVSTQNVQELPYVCEEKDLDKFTLRECIDIVANLIGFDY